MAPSLATTSPTRRVTSGCDFLGAFAVGSFDWCAMRVISIRTNMPGSMRPPVFKVPGYLPPALPLRVDKILVARRVPRFQFKHLSSRRGTIGAATDFETFSRKEIRQTTGVASLIATGKQRLVSMPTCFTAQASPTTSVYYIVVCFSLFPIETHAPARQNMQMFVLALMGVWNGLSTATLI